MQNAAFRRAGLAWLYLPFRVRSGELGAFVKQARRWRMAGFNVTIPHKVAVIRHLDRLSPEARAIGAVNTVVFRNGRATGARLAVGYNTDAAGYLASLREETGFRPRGRGVLILGAGGAARAVATILLKKGVRFLWLANRTAVRGRSLARDLRKLFPGRAIEALPLTTAALRAVLPRADLLVNATSVGWHGTHFRSLPLRLLPRSAVVSDLVYEPSTPLLNRARRLGRKGHGGLGMLVHQGAESFRLWTGRRPDPAAMRSALASLTGAGRSVRRRS